MKERIKNKTVFILTPEEYFLLKEVLIDEDKDKALLFVKEVLGKQVKEIERIGCVPVFEASYGPGQKDKFKNKP